VILLRSLLYYVLLMLSVGLFGLLVIITGTVSLAAADRWAARWGKANLAMQRWICGLDYRISGAENLPSQACIVMAKHQSAWETIALRALLPPQQSWVLKQELMRIPVFGTGLKIAKSIPIDRSAGRKAILKVVRDGVARLQEGRWVMIFPEGTRTQPGQRRKYGLGGAVLAQRSAVPVLPIAHNAGVFWRRQGVRKFPGTIDVVIGPLIPSEGRKAADIIADVENWIESTQEKLAISIDE
jgi:1-acyl-sn-glycerol-3-phosphate acyltransferase